MVQIPAGFFSYERATRLFFLFHVLPVQVHGEFQYFCKLRPASVSLWTPTFGTDISADTTVLCVSWFACADTWLVFIFLQASSCIDQPVDPDLWYRHFYRPSRSASHLTFNLDRNGKHWTAEFAGRYLLVSWVEWQVACLEAWAGLMASGICQEFTTSRRVMQVSVHEFLFSNTCPSPWDDGLEWMWQSLVLSCLVLSCLVLSCLVLSCLVGAIPIRMSGLCDRTRALLCFVFPVLSVHGSHRF